MKFNCSINTRITKAFILLISISLTLSSTFAVKELRNDKIETDENKVVDEKFLNVYNRLKQDMEKSGSKFGNFGVKFITKSNRFLVANEDMKVKIFFKQI